MIDISNPNSIILIIFDILDLKTSFGLIEFIKYLKKIKIIDESQFNLMISFIDTDFDLFYKDRMYNDEILSELINNFIVTIDNIYQNK